MSKKLIISLSVAAVIACAIAYFAPAIRDAQVVNSLIAKNLEARGGQEVWNQVTSMRMAGQMDLGQDMIVPYTLVQKRPGKMCFEFEFDSATSTQCTDGEKGWKIAPFLGRSGAEPMTEAEYRDVADSSDPYGLLYNYRERGLDIQYLGKEQIDGRDADKLRVELPYGGVRWLYLDAETALDVKLEAPRVVAGQDYLIETFYTDWQEVEGLLIPARQETRTVGDEQTHFLTVDSVTVNPQVDDDQFHMPATLGGGFSNDGGNAL